MIKAIIFDFGNVICGFDRNIFLNKLSKFSDKPVSKLREIIYASDPLRYASSPLKECETGSISSEEFYKKIKEMCSLSMPRDEFIKAHISIFTPIKTTCDLIRKLKHNYKIALLSNTDKWVFEHYMKKMEIFNLFDATSVSYKVKEAKPGKKIFLDALNKLNVKPAECIYIDDIKEFVDVSEQLGIHGIHYTSHNSLVNSLRRLNVKI